MTPSDLQGAPVMDPFQSTPPLDAREDTPILTVLEESHGSQLPPAHLGGSSLKNVIWKRFWTEKNNRKLFHKASDNLAKLKRATSKLWFLKQCLKYELVPKSCKTSIKCSENFSENGKQLWKAASFKASELFILTALDELKTTLVTLRECVCVREEPARSSYSQPYLAGSHFRQA